MLSGSSDEAYRRTSIRHGPGSRTESTIALWKPSTVSTAMLRTAEPREAAKPVHAMSVPSAPAAESFPLDAETAEAANSVWTLVFLSLLMAFASISTDIYLPAMPTMAGALRAGAGSVELTVSGYLAGFTIGQLFWGPLSDRWGRRLPIAIGMALFILGSAGCALAMYIHALIAWRAVQAVGACAGVTLGRAMVRDLYVGTRAAQIMSTLMIVGAIAPLVGPSLGGFILHVAQWRVIFWILVAVGAVTLGGLHVMPETLPEPRRVHEPLSRVLSSYGVLLR